MTLLVCLTLSALVLGRVPTAAFAADVRIELELVTESGFPMTGSHQWSRFLAELDFDRVRIRGAARGGRPAIETTGPATARSYLVTGVLSSRNQLRLPGGTFTLRDKAGLQDWIRRLAEDGEDGLTEDRVAFGLTPQQLIAVHESLGTKVRAPMQGERLEAAIATIVQDADQRLAIDADVAGLIREGGVVQDQVQGLASGTSLAALLRPLGLGFAPVSSPGGTVQLRVMADREATESWPVGWPPSKVQAKPIDLVPKLFERLEVEIADTPLAEVLAAVQQRLNVPLLVDHLALARRQIDPAGARVSFSQPRTYYWRILDQTTRQAGLKVEVRVDEAGQPFLWLTTRGPLGRG
jgi:hypothetical protein